ncbi:MAG: exosortase [Deltaproteobacteria bacterium]|nr:MAG: exosortase [Deltaproteobacteria bacterium]
MGEERVNYGYLREARWHFAVLALLTAALYWRIVDSMIAQWLGDPNYSHGFLIPLITLYFLYERRTALRAARIDPADSGLAVVLFGLFMLIAGYTATEFFTMRASLIVFISGVVIFTLGWAVTRVVALPLLYLFFMVPLPYIIYDAVAFPLKLFVAKYSVMAMKLMGLPVLREGNIIIFPEITLEVADACSGIRSLISLLALSVAFGFLTQKRVVGIILVALSAVPIAIITNGVRVIATGFLSQYYGAVAAEGFFHEFAGLTVFAAGLLLLGGVIVVVKRAVK